MLPVPSPPHRCDNGHMYGEPGCPACEDLARWAESFVAWLRSDEFGRWMDMQDAEEALWEQLQARKVAA